MKHILFGISQSSDKVLENGILEKYKEKVGKDFTFDSDYYNAGILQLLNEKQYDILIIKEDLEATNKITVDFLDKITDNHRGLRIIFIANNEHVGDNYIKRIFALGIYDVIYKEHLTLDNIVDLIEKPNGKREAKIYMEIDDLEIETSQENMQDIPDDKLQIILHNLKKATVETISEIFDEIDKAYNDKQMLFLLTVLPSSVKNNLIESKNEAYSIYNKRLLILSEEYSDGEEFSSSGAEQIIKTEKRTKVVTKIEKEYINSIPTDYNKVVAFVGSGDTGTTTVVDMVAKHFNENKKNVAVIELTKNKTLFYKKCWGHKELNEKQRRGLENLNKGSNNPIIIDENYTLYTQIEGNIKEFNFYNAIEQIRYDNDVILIDMDFSMRDDWLKYGVNAIYLVETLDVLEQIEAKEYIKELRELGVNTKKIHLLVNKFVNCKVKTEDILTMLSEPIPYLEYDNDINCLELSPQTFKIDFDIENYKKMMEAHMYMNDTIKLHDRIKNQIEAIGNHIYPLKDKKKKKSLLSFKIPFSKND